MNFHLNEAIEILERTPQTLERFLSGLSEGWLQSNEGEGTWNAHEMVEHFIEAEKHNWIPRVESSLLEGENNLFPAFDRFSHLKEISERTVEEALQEFSSIRMKNLSKLREILNPASHLEKTGLHPEFGIVKLRELLSAWVVHDFTHMAQIVRVMAERYRTDVGSWSAYLGILKRS
ncbi:DinB family protein [Paenibacillus maysiensis]|uniref:DinB family protein n=1 Tax=Paenibacillus maysiensis TaxID=1155954 RepID=UPI00046FAE83|nr:DinB family protein [Paenibacillus maysiensis]